MEAQSKKQSLWSTFKKAYLKSKNLKSFWNRLDKTNFSKELVDTFNLYLNSESYNWSAKNWRHNIINHLKIMNDSNQKNTNSLISQDYFTFTYINEPLIKDAWNEIQDKKINLDINLFKRQTNFSLMQSLNHNLILLLLYETVKSRKVFNHLDKLKELESKPSLLINNKEITQDNLNSLLEFEQIEILLGKNKKRKNNILEVGAGSGRTAKAILSIMDNVKYVIADIPPAINFCKDSLNKYFPNKKISTAFEINNQEDLMTEFQKNDILFIFPHQIKLFEKNTFDITLAIDCLHEMEKKIIKIYMSMFEDVSTFLYFKVWEYSGLNYSFYQYHSIHNKKDYAIKDHWKEHLKEKCLYPSNFFQLGYEF